MTTPKFVITPVNDRIKEAATKGNRGIKQHPAVYTLTTLDGQVYVGSTGAVDTRLTQHKSKLNTGKHHCPELQAAVEKDQPIQVTIEYMPSREAAFDAEQVLIDKNAGNSNLLNKAIDARSPAKGSTLSEETKQKIREASIGRTPSEYCKQRTKEVNTGRVHSEESRLKMSNSKKGKTRTPATCEAIS